MDRFQEFEEILFNYKNLKTEEIENKSSVTSLRNRFEIKKENEESSLLHLSLATEEQQKSIYQFSKSFISECNLINTTIIQLKTQIRKISQKPDQISFSIQLKQLHGKSNNSSREIEEALNICSMNLSVLGNKLRALESENKNENNKLKTGGFIFSWFSSRNIHKDLQNPMLEHCRLVLSFLEAKIGRVTEDLESYKTRQKNRDKILNSVSKINPQKIVLKPKQSVVTSTPSTFDTETPKDYDSNNYQSPHQHQAQLQLENSQMIEEMSRGLFETLSTTETQVLEISRLQSTLQSHLCIQYDQTCRLFEDSQSTFSATKQGNEYLRKTGKDSSVMRKFLVGLIIIMSLILLFIHYFN